MFFFKRKDTAPVKLCFSTDIHCHLAPGIDDGQTDAAAAAELVEVAAGWGLKKVFCTPHIIQDRFENTPATISEAFARLVSAVKERGVEIELDYSAEHRLDSFFLEELSKGHIRPFPNDYLLVENSFLSETWDMDQVLFDLKLKGFKPILAHPERYAYYFDKKGPLPSVALCGNFVPGESAKSVGALR